MQAAIQCKCVAFLLLREVIMLSRSFGLRCAAASHLRGQEHLSRLPLKRSFDLNMSQRRPAVAAAVDERPLERDAEDLQLIAHAASSPLAGEHHVGQQHALHSHPPIPPRGRRSRKHSAGQVQHSQNPTPRPRVGNTRPDELYDLGTTLVVDSTDKSLHLNSSQSDAIFQLRKKLYQSSLRQIVIVLQSHLSPLEKCHRLVLLHDKLVVKNRLRLRDDTYEEIFHTFYAVSTLGRSDLASSTNFYGVANAAAGQQSQEVSPQRDGGGGAGDEDSTAHDIHTQTSPFLHPVWTMYRYMIDSGTNPTPRIVQHVMGLLSRVRRRNIDVEARAHSLTMDCDRFQFPPTEYTVGDYCRVCTINNAMHLAMARVTDLYTRHEKAPSANVAATLLHGLTVNGHHDQALKFMATMQNVAVTPSLLHSCLQAGRHSKDPSAAFAFYSSLRGSGLRPTHQTISILVEAATLMSKAVEERLNEILTSQQSLQHSGGNVSSSHHQNLRQLQQEQLEKQKEKLRHVVLHVLLRDTTRFKVRLNHHVFNKLLQLLVDVDHKKSFVALCRALMRRQGHRAVFKERFPQDWIAEAEIPST